MADRLRKRREEQGLSQIALGAAAGISRQTVNAIEAGRTQPGVEVAIRIARVLGATVEELFGGDSSTESRVVAEPLAGAATGRVALAEVGGRWLSYPLRASGMRTSADGLAKQRARANAVEVDAIRSLDQARENVIVMGCAAALGLLADRLNSMRGAGRFVWVPSSSTAALEAIRHRQVHIAGVHLVDGRTGESNVADVRRYVGLEPVALITLARWEAGLVMAAGEPRRIERPEDLGRRGLRLVTRERGSGARRLLDRVLHRAGVGERVSRGALQAEGHLEVAHTVSIGAADVGVATRDTAIAFGLGFLPLAEERYDLVIPIAALDEPRIGRLLDTMTAAPVRRELTSLGYDMRTCGDRVADINAA